MQEPISKQEIWEFASELSHFENKSEIKQRLLTKFGTRALKNGSYDIDLLMNILAEIKNSQIQAKRNLVISSILLSFLLFLTLYAFYYWKI